MSPDEGRRRNIWIPDDLWADIVKAAARETLETGEQVSAAEYIRQAIVERIEREK